MGEKSNIINVSSSEALNQIAVIAITYWGIPLGRNVLDLPISHTQDHFPWELFMNHQHVSLDKEPMVAQIPEWQRISDFIAWSVWVAIVIQNWLAPMWAL